MKGPHWSPTVIGLTLSGLTLAAVLGQLGVHRSVSTPGLPTPITMASAKGRSTVPHRSALPQLPMSFESNVGQTPSEVRYLSHGRKSTLFLTENGAVINMKSASKSSKSASVRMHLVGSAKSPRVRGSDPLPGKVNYLLGNDRSKWRLDVPTYGQVRYDGVYPGVDMVYYGTEGKLEYDFIVAPKADPGQVRMSFQGAESVRIDKSGDLVVRSGGAEVKQVHPTVYQDIDGRRKLVASAFQVTNRNEVGFQLGDYDRTRALTIDPYLAYGTYLGRSAGEDPWPLAVDNTGIYMAGATGTDWYTSANTSTTYPSWKTANSGNADIFLTKMNLEGSALIYSTFIGASGDDRAYAMAVDGSQNVYLTGYTTSNTNFPGTSNNGFTKPAATLTGARGGQDVYVLKVGPTGNTIGYISVMGGTNNEVGQGIALDASGNVYVSGNTVNAAGTPAANQFMFGVPTTGVAQPSPVLGDSDAFVVKFNTSGTPVLGTYLGGGGTDSGRRVVVDSGGNVITCGVTRVNASIPTAFPTTAGALQTTNHGSDDMFLTKLNPDFSLSFSTLIGGDNPEDAEGLALDSSNNIYVSGTSGSYAASGHLPYPTTASAYQSALSGNVNADAVLSEFSPTGGLVYSTYFGSANNSELSYGVVVDDTTSPGHTFAWFDGYTQSTSGFPLKNATQPSYGGGARDGFLAEIDTTVSGSAGLVFSTYYGGNGLDEAHAIARQSGVCPMVYIYGTTVSGVSGGSVSTPYAFQPAKWDQLTDADAFLARFSSVPAPTANAPADFSYICTGINTSVPVSGSGTPVAGQSIIAWNFAEGSTVLASGTNPPGPSYNFNANISLTIGVHTIVLTVEDSCFDRGTATFHVTVTEQNPPHITGCPSDIGPRANDAGKCYATVNPGTVTTTDDCGAPVTVTGVASPGNLAVSSNTARQFPIDTSTGITTYTVTWTATNTAGLSSTCTQHITVYDNESPVVSHAATNIAVTAAGGATSASVDPRSGAPTFTDNCSVAYLVGFRDNPGLPDTGLPADLSGSYPLGQSVITWIAMDAYLNFTTTLQTVTVHGADSVSSTFSTNDEGWYVNNNATLSYLSSGGSPGGGGAIRGNDSASENWCFFSPSKFSGNQSAAFGQALTFQLKANTNASNKNVTITGGGLTITNSIAPGTLNAWTSYSLTLNNAGGWKLNGTATAATDAQVKQVLGSVQTIKIPATFGPLVGSQSCLDTVVLNRSY